MHIMTKKQNNIDLQRVSNLQNPLPLFHKRYTNEMLGVPGSLFKAWMFAQSNMNLSVVTKLELYVLVLYLIWSSM